MKGRLMTSAVSVIAASNYPLLNAFWTMLLFFVWILWIFLLVRTIIDVFRSDDLSGLAKALWLIFLIVLPYIGVFVYLIARGDSMNSRDVTTISARRYDGSVASELSQLSALRDNGTLTQAEFDAQKARLLA
jgi:hypothetical protein